MIKKLRIKFIFINMISVLLILFVVLTTVFLSNCRRISDDTWNYLGMIVNTLDHSPQNAEKMQRPVDTRQKDFPIIPAVVVTLDESLNITDKKEIELTMSDEFMKNMINTVIASDQDKGTLEGYDMIYLRRNTPSGIRIAFSIHSYITNQIYRFLISSLLIFLGCGLAIFVFSFFLSRWALRPVETAWHQQSQFVADASHELRTPLTVILANLNIMSSNKKDTIENQERWLINTKEEAERMKQLVDDLLFLAKSDAETLPAIMSEFDFSDACWSCLLPFESIAFEKHITLNSDIAPGLRYTGNEGNIKQLIVILLDNACKYAGKDGTVNISALMLQDKICLNVQNTGEPIPAESIDHIFERFYRPDKARSHEEGGYGLGLSIARNIVSMHHGKISVISNAEIGTKFTILF